MMRPGVKARAAPGRACFAGETSFDQTSYLYLYVFSPFVAALATEINCKYEVKIRTPAALLVHVTEGPRLISVATCCHVLFFFLARTVYGVPFMSA